MADTNIIRFSEVLSVDDDKAGMRIRVRLEPEDADCKTTDELPWCFPLLPKHLHINPKVGECVMVILTNAGVAKATRLFIGPVISQSYSLNYDPFYYRARCLLGGDQIAKPYEDPALNPENEGSVPDRDDIVIQGRQNCDVVLKDSEMRLRCGFKQHPTGKADNTLLFNREDLGYIQMRYKQLRDSKGRDFSSVINLVSDRINLLSHDSVDAFRLNDREELITDDELINIVDNAHPMVYGDLLVSFLKQLCAVIRTHTHPFPTMPPALDSSQVSVVETDLDSMLSQGIKVS
ncbi:MAG: hypothetical protein LUD72_00040 [Bacteroidales bacterium]|nr:hypothetical protein [Bacteroidales bacterium]